MCKAVTLATDDPLMLLATAKQQLRPEQWTQDVMCENQTQKW